MDQRAWALCAVLENTAKLALLPKPRATSALTTQQLDKVLALCAKLERNALRWGYLKRKIVRWAFTVQATALSHHALQARTAQASVSNRRASAVNATPDRFVPLQALLQRSQVNANLATSVQGGIVSPIQPRTRVALGKKMTTFSALVRTAVVCAREVTFVQRGLPALPLE
jgi:hypothetical protein